MFYGLTGCREPGLDHKVLILHTLLNLVGNALHYTQTGGSVRLTARQEGAEVYLVVEDTGTGIRAEHLPHVFERFYRVDKSRSRAGGGSGIGLTIAKHLVEAQGVASGPRVWVQDRGAPFTLRCRPFERFTHGRYERLPPRAVARLSLPHLYTIHMVALRRWAILYSVVANQIYQYGGVTMMGLGMGFGLLFVVLFSIGLIALAVWLVGTRFPRNARPTPAGEQAPSARQILDERYARGEVNREEYELMKQDISDRQV